MQLALSILEKRGISLDEEELGEGSTHEQPKKCFHEKVFEALIETFKEEGEKEGEVILIKSNFKNLKQLRVKADYRNYEIKASDVKYAKK